MNSRRIVFLLAFFVLIFTGTGVATAVPRSDDPVIQEIFNKWAERDKANKRLFAKCRIEYFFTGKGKLRQAEFGESTLAIDGQKYAASFDVMPRANIRVWKIASKLSIDGEYKRFLDVREPSFPFRFFGIPKFSHGTIRPLDKKSSTISISAESAVFLAYCPMRFFFKNSYQLSKAKIVERDIDIDGRKCLKLEIPMTRPKPSPKPKPASKFKKGQFIQLATPNKNEPRDPIKLKAIVWVEQSSRHLPYRYQDFDGVTSKNFIDINYDFSPDGSWKLAKWTLAPRARRKMV